jgi:hypothetical protein
MRRADLCRDSTSCEQRAQFRPKRLIVHVDNEAEPGRSKNKERAVPSYDAVVWLMRQSFLDGFTLSIARFLAVTQSAWIWLKVGA